MAGVGACLSDPVLSARAQKISRRDYWLSDPDLRQHSHAGLNKGNRGPAHAARRAPSPPAPALPPPGAAPASRRDPPALPTARPTPRPPSPPSAPPRPVVGCALAVIISAKRRCARRKWCAPAPAPFRLTAIVLSARRRLPLATLRKCAGSSSL